ncbi:potassium channel family protein [Pseudonocardia sichuanensis]
MNDEVRDPVPRRHVVRSLLLSTAASALLVLAYYVLPLDAGPAAALVWLVAGLAAVAAVLMWQVRAIAAARYPRLRAIGALAVGLPLLLVVFAATYLLLDRNNPASFSQPLDRTGALYFSVTVLATVGFGDITPVTPAARIVTMVQMLLDLVAFGLAANAIFGAVDEGLRRRSAQGRDADPR